LKLSVVTPSKNQAKFLGETLSSVRQAAAKLDRGEEIEHWVMDGASEDGTVALLEGQDFAKWESRPDTGQASAVNQGWSLCSGDVFCFLCADDLWLPETASLVLSAFRSHPDVSVVYGDYYFLEGDSGWHRLRRTGTFSHRRLLRHNFLSQPATFIRREVYEAHGGLREDLRFCMDHEFWLRIHRQVQWLYLKKPLATMRLHAETKTTSQLAQAWWETARMARGYGVGTRFFLKACWMQVAGQYLYRWRRKLYRRIGAEKTPPDGL